VPVNPKPALGIVIPVYNEEHGLEACHRQLMTALQLLPAEPVVYYVNDGSTDGTEDILQRLAAEDHRVVVVTLSRNFGHQAALTAGLDLVPGDVIITMDGDGQHPPALLQDMLRLYEAGYEVVLAQRNDAGQSGPLKRVTSEGFYWVLSKIGDTRMIPGAADFRLMSRAVVDSLKGMREYHRFLRGMVAWLGYRTVILPYTERARLAGKTKHSLRKMLRLASDAVSSFSLVPLRVGIALGFSFFVVAALEVGYVLWFWLRGQHDRLVPGWSSLMFAILLVGGLVMILLGLVGSYVGYIFQEVKRRPVYVVRTMAPSRGTRPGEASSEAPPPRAAPR
jgi:dolichol-phosphate mannosyltransferase